MGFCGRLSDFVLKISALVILRSAEKHMKRIEAAESYASQAMEMLSAVNDLANSLGDREVAKAEAELSALSVTRDLPRVC